MQLLKSILFTALLFVSVVPYSLWAVLARPWGREASYRVGIRWVRMVLGACRVLCGLDHSVVGTEHFTDQSCVVFMKHSSAYETISQFLLVPAQTWVLKRELMWAPFLGWALASLSPIAINRSAGRSAVEQVVAQGKDRLEKGLWVFIFPEGTRVRMGETRRYGVSGALLAQAAGVPIIPVAHDAGDYWPRRGLRKKPGTIQFVVGPPIDPAGREAREVSDEVQTWIESTVSKIRR